MEIDNGITTQIADAVIELLEQMEDKNGDKIFIKVNLGRIDRLVSHNGVISEVYVNDEKDFEYTLDEEEHNDRKVEVIIAVYVKGVDDKPERLKLNIKDLVIKLIENNPTLNDLTKRCTIDRVDNGRRAEGREIKPTLFGASMIHVEYTVNNYVEYEEPKIEDIEWTSEVN